MTKPRIKLTWSRVREGFKGGEESVEEGGNLREGISFKMRFVSKSFLEKFGGGFEQDIDEEEEEKWRG
ncbi:hypothetical protein Tco_0013561 [Tanacetum coccineum]